MSLSRLLDHLGLRILTLQLADALHIEQLNRKDFSQTGLHADIAITVNKEYVSKCANCKLT